MSRLRRNLFAAGVLALVWPVLSPGKGADGRLPVLTSIGQLRGLSKEQANRHYPVHVRGVVTFFHIAPPDLAPRDGELSTNFFIQDASGGNWVRIEPGSAPLKAGYLVEVDGLTEQAEFAPDIVHARWRVLGRAPLPQAVRSEFGQLASTEEDSRWVEIQGIVRSAGMVKQDLRIEVAMDGGRVSAYVPDFRAGVPAGLIDAKVRLQGVCGAIFNVKNQLRGVTLFVPSMEQVHILKRGADDPFSLPVRSIDSVLRFTAGGAAGHRVRLQGRVTLQRPRRFLFLQDGDGSMRVESRQALRLQPGQKVDAVGFPEIATFGPVLREATLRASADIDKLQPEATTGQAILEDRKDGVLVQIDAKLLDRTTAPGEQILIAASGGAVIQAELEEPAANMRLARLQPGSVVRLTGVTSLRDEADGSPGAIHLLLRSARDITILSKPSWLTFRRAAWGIAGMAGLVIAIAAWLAVLRRKLSQQTRIIQQRLETESALEKRYRQLFERNLAGVYRMSQAGEILDANDACARILGYQNRSELLGQAGREFMLREPILKRLSDGKRITSSEVSLRLKNGSEIWVLVNASLLEDEGEPTIEGTVIDITELKEAVRTLEERTSYLHALITNNPLGVVVINARGRVISCNRAFEQLFLFSSAEILGRDIDELVIQQNAATSFNGQLRLLAAGETTFNTVQAWRTDGTSIELEVRGVPIITDGTIAGFYAIYEDISARVAAEKELRATKESAETANRAKSEFLANMSHEIRTPLNGVLLAAELAADENLSPTQREYLDTIRASGESLLLLLNDLLDLSKIEAGKMELHSATFSIEACLESCIGLMEGRAKQKCLNLSLEIAEGCPDLVKGDSLRLRQVILNLLGNAVKFTHRGSVTVRVRYTGMRSERLLYEFSIEDTGIGIPADKHAAVFKKFEQADTSTTRRFGGTGLGLAISRRLVELLGGRIWLKSEVGQGSIFYFTATFSAAHEHNLEDTDGSALTPLEGTGSLRILLAEDNAINKRLAVRLLEKDGHSVAAVETGTDAVNACTQGSFDIVLMDIHMPEMDGIEAARTIRIRERESGRHTPIIAMTASAMKEDREACVDAGMDAFLSKPICAAELLATLRELSASTKASTAVRSEEQSTIAS